MRCCSKHRFDARTKSGKKHPRRLPQQQPPVRIEEAYAKALAKLVIKSLREAYAKVVEEAPKLAQAKLEKRQGPLHEDSDESRKVQSLIAEAAQNLRGRVNKPQIANLARKFGQQTATYQRIQLNNQVQDVLGVDVPVRDPDVADRTSDFVRQNVALVSRIPQYLHADLEGMVHQAVVQGRPNKDLADDIEKRFKVAESHARLIARDQIGKLYADINHHRQRRLGVQKFIWRTLKDERVRGDPDGKYPNALPSHYDLEGLMFSYDDPPVPEGADGPLLPGDDYQCRCYAEPVLDDLLSDDDDGEDVDDENEDEGDDVEDDGDDEGGLIPDDSSDDTEEEGDEEGDGEDVDDDVPDDGEDVDDDDPERDE